MGIGGTSLDGDGDRGGVVCSVGCTVSFTFVPNGGASLVMVLGVWLLGRVPFAWCSDSVAT